ncbi:TetR/AcrR family transcriptional regulator [Actinomadura sp. WMMB 499]|uniref:TetR/AcrR family transcriptional regulator n=1 Tax=Actinomadura sp. WMMB 499 TaxID=1219491 RepID=UPI001246E9CA|nr:TetR/AcrR family transcriptional regulator [Actinomadura sp. WMMB 499]QFG21022.1 TetR/AcrR family transcriptional regulator [Actinomadura sp. WMMB 499]
MPTGRPREFDVDERLDRALDVFWRQGYEGTALSDLTEAMGINRPSLYAAYGNKDALFRKALDRYAEGPAGYVRAALAEPSARAVAAAILKGTIDVTTSGPGGCLFVQGALVTGRQNEAARREIETRRRRSEEMLARRFERARVEGDLPPGTDTAALARYVWSVSYGLSVQAAAGTSREDLRRAADLALDALPPRPAPDA